MVVHFAIHMYASGAQKNVSQGGYFGYQNAMLEINVNFRVNVLFLFLYCIAISWL